MKKKNIFLLAALAGLSFAGCNKTPLDSASSIPTEAPSAITGPLSRLTVRAGTPGTKITGMNEDDAINDLQVMVFGADGKLEAYGHENGMQVSLECTNGEKKIYAFVNTPSLAAIRDTVELKTHPFSLLDAGAQALPMQGCVVTMVSGNGNLVIPVNRMVCKIAIKRIKMQETEHYTNPHLELERIYLANAVSAVDLDGNISEWSNPLRFFYDCSPLLYDLYEDDPLAIDMEQALGNYFYTFPNSTPTDIFSPDWCPRYTRLVLEGKFYDGAAFVRKGYYPISLAGLKANNCYIVDSYTITRPGLEQPYEDESKLTEGISIRVADWVENDPINESL